MIKLTNQEQALALVMEFSGNEQYVVEVSDVETYKSDLTRGIPMKIRAKDLAGYMLISEEMDKAIKKHGKTNITISFDIKGDEARKNITGCLMALCKHDVDVVASVSQGSNRSLQLNATMHAMYKAMYLQGAFDSFNDARAYCKWHFGIPILERDKEGFKESFESVFGRFKSNYEACMRLMNSCKPFPYNGYPVTSGFTVKQACEYVDTIANTFTGAGDHPMVDFTEILK